MGFNIENETAKWEAKLKEYDAIANKTPEDWERIYRIARYLDRINGTVFRLILNWGLAFKKSEEKKIV